jgi:hypothetical protein
LHRDAAAEAACSSLATSPKDFPSLIRASAAMCSSFPSFFIVNRTVPLLASSIEEYEYSLAEKSTS